MKRTLVAMLAAPARARGGEQARAQEQAAPPAAPYDAALFSKDTMIPMRDGAKLATDIYRPALG